MQTQVYPTYSTQIAIPDGLDSITLQIRFFTPWGDGSIDGWKQTVTPPTVKFNDNVMAVNTWFDYYDGIYMDGQLTATFDQHSQYFQTNGIFLNGVGGVLSIDGGLIKAAYYSFSICGYAEPHQPPVYYK